MTLQLFRSRSQKLWLPLVLLLPMACSDATSTDGSSSNPTASTGTTGTATGLGGASSCVPCVHDADCGAGKLCGQLGGDSYCAEDCSSGQVCAAGSTCTVESTVEGVQASLCVAQMGICGGAATSTSTSSTGSGAETCGALVGPDVSSCCSSCSGTSGTKACQANGCYGGWWCNTESCGCQAPPDPSACDGASSTSSSTSSSSSSTGSGMGGAGNGGTVGPDGGTLDTLSFVVVGDTRPPNEGDLGGYPTAIVTKIWKDVEALNPRPAFGVTTGDYQFSDPSTSEASAQMDLYLTARENFSNITFPALGNHECTGATASNCGTGNTDGITKNYQTYLDKFLTPIGQSKPYYSIDVNGTSGWTAKFVFVAANAWDSTQSSWLKTELAKPTTYTFVVRHEGTTISTTPGVNPSEAIIAQHPLTLRIEGHTHTWAHYPSTKELIVGNGGAPLTGSVNYGYTVVRQRSSDGALGITAYDYQSNAIQKSFFIKADGSATQ